MSGCISGEPPEKTASKSARTCSQEQTLNPPPHFCGNRKAFSPRVPCSSHQNLHPRLWNLPFQGPTHLAASRRTNVKTARSLGTDNKHLLCGGGDQGSQCFLRSKPDSFSLCLPFLAKLKVVGKHEKTSILLTSGLSDQHLSDRLGEICLPHTGGSTIGCSLFSQHSFCLTNHRGQ